MNSRMGLLLAVMVSAFTFSGAQAAVTLGFDVGTIAIAYSDGYWDDHHQWHAWQDRQDMERFRAEHADLYHDWRHDDRGHHGAH